MNSEISDQGTTQPNVNQGASDPAGELDATKQQVRRRKIILLTAQALVALLFVGGAIYSGLFFLSHADNVSELAGSSARANEEPPPGAASVGADAAGDGAGIPGKQASDPRFAFLLMGFGGGAHDGGYLTDSMMVVIVDPNQKTLTLLSIPRDTWVPILFDGQNAVYSKINTAYAYARDAGLYTNRLAKYKGSQGAGTLAMDTVGRILGIPISNYLAMDFAGFREMINTVGGIDVEVPESFSAEYPANDDPSIDPSWTVVSFRKGSEHMNGERAIQFARARETIDNISEGSDFARSRRQRLIMEAFKRRLLQPEGLVHLPQLLAIGAGHVDTNYSFPSVAQLAQMALDWKEVKFYQTALTNTNYLTDANGPEGTYTLVPDNPEYSWVGVRALCHRLWENPELGVAMANTEVVVENDSGTAGVATRVGAALSRLGYRVGSPAEGAVRVQSRAVDRTGGAAGPLLHQLEADLHIQLEQAASKDASGGLTLEIGSGDAGLAQLVVPLDALAPSSAFGIVHVGWSPALPTPSHTPTPAGPSPSPSAPGVPTRVGGTPAPTRTPSAAPGRGTPATTPAAGAGSGTPSATRIPAATAGGSPPVATHTPAPAVQSAATPASAPPSGTAPSTTTPAPAIPTARAKPAATSAQPSPSLQGSGDASR